MKYCEVCNLRIGGIPVIHRNGSRICYDCFVAEDYTRLEQISAYTLTRWFEYVSGAIAPKDIAACIHKAMEYLLAHGVSYRDLRREGVYLENPDIFGDSIPPDSFATERVLAVVGVDNYEVKEIPAIRVGGSLYTREVWLLDSEEV